MEKLKDQPIASYSQPTLLTGRYERECIKKRNGKVNIKDLNNIDKTNKIANGYDSLINKIKDIKQKETTITEQKKIAKIAEFENINNDKDVKNQFKNFIDYLTVALRSRYSGFDVSEDKILFADKSNGLGKFSITRNGIKEYLDFIFRDEGIKTTDDEIDAILEMCTHRHTSFSSVTSYTNTTKEFLTKIGIENINNKNLIQIKNLLENPLCNENTFDYFIMISIIKGNLNYSNKETLFNSFNKNMKSLTNKIFFDNYFINNTEAYESNLNEVVNKFKVPEAKKENTSNAFKLVDSALQNHSACSLNVIFEQWSSFELNSDFFSSNKNLISQNILEKIIIILNKSNFDNRELDKHEMQKSFFTKGLKAALKLANPSTYNFLSIKALEYYNKTKDDLVLNNILTTIDSKKHFESFEFKEELLELIINSKSEFHIKFIAEHYQFNNNNNSCINSLFLENLNHIDRPEDKKLLKSLCDFYEKFKDIIKIDDDVKNHLILKVFTYAKPEDKMISDELITEFSTHVNQNYHSFLLLKNENSLNNWINFTKNSYDYNNFINICLKLDIIDDQLLQDILKNYDLLSMDNKKMLLNFINFNMENKQKYLQTFLNSLIVNYNEDAVFLNKLISTCLSNINDFDPNFINLLCNKCDEFKDLIYNYNLNSLASILLSIINTINNKDIFLDHINNFLHYIKATKPKWSDIFNDNKYVFNYIDACYQNNIFNISTLEILTTMLINNTYHKKEHLSYAKKLNYLIYMANTSDLPNISSLIDSNIHTILNSYQEPKLKLFIAFLFKNSENYEFSNKSLKDLIVSNSENNDICKVFFNNKKTKIMNVDKYFEHINSIINLESIINHEFNTELFNKLLLIKNMNNDLKQSLVNYSNNNGPERNQKRLQQIFEFFIQALFDKNLTTENLIQLFKDPQSILFIEEKNKDFLEAFDALRVHNNIGRTSSLNPKETTTWKMLKNAAIPNENLRLSRKTSNGSNSTTDSLSEKDSIIRSTELN